jgi:4-hydroxy-2-oxoheptanedioate aldolase
LIYPILSVIRLPMASKILDAAHKAGKKAGIYTTSNEDARKRVEQGFDMVHIGTDVGFLAGGVGAAVAAAQGKAAAPAKGGY